MIRGGTTLLIGALGTYRCRKCDYRESWLAFAKFAEDVIRAKEEAECIKKTAVLSPDVFDLG